jgi:hypothetical protein
MISRYIFILAATLMISCDCLTYKSGIILEAQTGEPVEGAKITFNDQETYSDSTGYFSIIKVSGFCPKEALIVTKDAYKSFELKVGYSGDYVTYTIKNQKEFIQCEQPIPHPVHDNSTLNGETRFVNSTRFTTITPDSLVIYLEKAEME